MGEPPEPILRAEATLGRQNLQHERHLVRERLTDDERRDKPLRIRLTPEERAVIDKAAEYHEESSARWARETLLREATKAADQQIAEHSGT